MSSPALPEALREEVAALRRGVRGFELLDVAARNDEPPDAQ
jgi:hypothetical protein